MTRDEVTKLMESATTGQEWNDACDAVKKACGGYPDFWFHDIIQSGLAARVSARWGGTDQLQIRPITLRK